MLVGGNDVQKDDDPGCAGRRSVWAGAYKVPITRTCGGRRCTWCVYGIKTTHLHSCKDSPMLDMQEIRLQALCSGGMEEMDVKEDPPPANIHSDMHNYDSCPRCRADGNLTQSQPCLPMSMRVTSRSIPTVQLESPEREPLT